MFKTKSFDINPGGEYPKMKKISIKTITRYIILINLYVGACVMPLNCAPEREIILNYTLHAAASTWLIGINKITLISLLQSHMLSSHNECLLSYKCCYIILNVWNKSYQSTKEKKRVSLASKAPV